MGIAIVAIPEQQDPVWKYSSDKIPHMTLLYLGDPGPDFDEAHAAEYIQHIADNSVEPFWMSVDHRGVLGPDNADVLFFRKDFIEKRIEEVRSYLLKDDDLARAFQAASTYPEWIPHLTMGYPTAPAKEDDRDYPGFGSVHFDQLAFWTDDFDGPSFQLTHPDRYDYPPDTVAWSDGEDHSEDLDDVEDFLEHQGVKGMHWGVRKDDYHGASKKVNKEARKDATEFARAKLFYGEGAGNRRKLIKAKVESKSARDSSYKNAFDHHLARQDLGRHASKAQGERHRKDVKNSVGKTARGVNRIVNGQFAAPIGAAALVAGAGYVHAKGYDAYALQVGKNFVEKYL